MVSKAHLIFYLDQLKSVGEYFDTKRESERLVQELKSLEQQNESMESIYSKEM